MLDHYSIAETRRAEPAPRAGASLAPGTFTARRIDSVFAAAAQFRLLQRRLKLSENNCLNRMTTTSIGAQDTLRLGGGSSIRSREVDVLISPETDRDRPRHARRRLQQLTCDAGSPMTRMPPAGRIPVDPADLRARSFSRPRRASVFTRRQFMRPRHHLQPVFHGKLRLGDCAALPARYAGGI